MGAQQFLLTPWASGGSYQCVMLELNTSFTFTLFCFVG